jgi:hypothetical protein
VVEKVLEFRHTHTHAPYTHKLLISHIYTYHLPHRKHGTRAWGALGSSWVLPSFPLVLPKEDIFFSR